MFRNYDPGQIVVSFRGIQIVGFMDGTFVSAERAEDGFTMAVGATGDVVRVRNRNRTGSITFTLQQASPANDLLSAVAAEDELFGTGYGIVQVVDINGTTVLDAPVAWIRKLPNVEYAKDHSGREWVLDCADLSMHVGSAVI